MIEILVENQNGNGEWLALDEYDTLAELTNAIVDAVGAAYTIGAVGIVSKIEDLPQPDLTGENIDYLFELNRLCRPENYGEAFFVFLYEFCLEEEEYEHTIAGLDKAVDDFQDSFISGPWLCRADFIEDWICNHLCEPISEMVVDYIDWPALADDYFMFDFWESASGYVFYQNY